MRLLFIALCLALPVVGAEAQQAKQAQQATPEPPEFREMQQVEDRWSTAVTKRDQYGMELVLAPQFIGVSATGDVTTRNQQIAALFVKGMPPEALEQKVVSVRFVGDVAIVNGTYVMTWKGEKGPILEKGIFSHVYEHVRSNWMCLNSQHTVVAEVDTGAPVPKVKHGDSGSSFHLPFIYKGPNNTQPSAATSEQPQPPQQ
jgi:hypothetical protein